MGVSKNVGVKILTQTQTTFTMTVLAGTEDKPKKQW